MEEVHRDDPNAPTAAPSADAVPGGAAFVVRDMSPDGVPGGADLDVEGVTSQDADAAKSQADELEAAIQAFLADMGSGVVSVSRVVNPLLQVWSVARDVDAGVAAPVENLLTVLVGRSLTTSQELEETMTEVRAVLAEAGPGSLASV